MIVEGLDAAWSVWIFLRIENPLSESALEAGMDIRPAINFSFANRGWPSKVRILPTSHQNAPDLGLSPVADGYMDTEGWSAGESLKSMNSSLSRLRDVESSNPS